MIATMTIQPSRTAQAQERRFSHSANSAGAPLPLIPRRTSSSRPALSCSPSMPLPVRSSASVSSLSSYTSSSSCSSSTTITTLAPPHDSDSSSTSSSPSDGTRPTVRTRRVRGVRTSPVAPGPVPGGASTLTIVSSPSPAQHAFPSKGGDAPHSAPAASRPMLYTPGMPLRASATASRGVSESPHVSPSSSAGQIGTTSTSASCDTFRESRMVRKKSGQVVKSSLKSSRSVSRGGGLSVFTMTQASKSEPTTPTSKAVHFDSKLEHVKLFLAEQKPLAVSRDGSPTDDTSGTDSDFPRFIFGTEQGEHDGRRVSRRRLVMQVANMPVRVAPYTDNVAIEEMALAADGASILGKVRVRNLAFAKWIAVRFTFDNWQTTSEVAGKYLDSPSPEFDRFSFAIRLNDLLARIEGKTLLLAVRYSIEGREMWDNNGGQNYLVTFTKTKIEEPSAGSPVAKRATTLSDDEASTDMMDLRSKLEKVVDTNNRTGPAFVQQSTPRMTTASRSADADTASFRSAASFASRYDFAQSFKSSWDPDAHVHAVHNRTQSFPLTGNARVPWGQTSPSDPYALRRTPTKAPCPAGRSLGSPRDLTDVDALDTVARRQHLFVETGSDTAPFQPQPRRNHNRGYFDLALPSGPLPPSLKRTPPGTPRSPLEFDIPSPLQGRYTSLPPPHEMNASDETGFLAAEYADSSELSTPSMVTPTSSRESTPSPSPTELYARGADISPDTHYRQFLNKFCFFTGQVNAPASDDGSAELPRTHSASDIEEFLSGLPHHLQLGAADQSSSPSRSSSLDDIAMNRSGSLTPTISRMALARALDTVTVVSPAPVLL